MERNKGNLRDDDKQCVEQKKMEMEKRTKEWLKMEEKRRGNK